MGHVSAEILPKNCLGNLEPACPKVAHTCNKGYELLRDVTNGSQCIQQSVYTANQSRRSMMIFTTAIIGGLQPIPRDPKDNGVAAMLDDRTKVLSSNMAAKPLSFWISGDWLQTTNNTTCLASTLVCSLGYPRTANENAVRKIT